MASQSALDKGLLGLFVAMSLMAVGVGSAGAQALLVDRLGNGTDLVLVSQPLADATTLAWPAPETDGSVGIRRLVAGRLTLATDVESAMTGGDDDPGAPLPAPQVVVAVGGVSAGELQPLLDRVLRDRPAQPVAKLERGSLVEGGLDRRLGAPGSDALLRLEVQLPPAGDWRRSPVEVLWDLVPQLLADVGGVMYSRVEEDRGVLEARVDAELAEIAVREVRLGLARMASDPGLQTGAVVDARRRLHVRRQALLEAHPDGAERILERWLAGGEDAVREFVFGLEAVTLERVRDAAVSWLGHHPGRAQLVLPPRVFNPRFAGGPQTVRLDSDVTAAILERSGASLAVVCLRPVVVPDLDGAVTATVLTRLARELRAAADRPGWVRVLTTPPMLEVAGPVDGFGELLEQLSAAYRRVAEDRSPVTASADDARRRALDLMAGKLGVSEADGPSPATLLRGGNLALGVVAADAEAAGEALRKFWAAGGDRAGSTEVHDVGGGQRTRVAAPGGDSVLVAALELVFGGDEAVTLVVREIVESRASALWPDSRVTVFHPFVPGRSLLLLEVASRGTLDEVETLIEGRWSELMSPITEDDLAPVKRRVAAASSAEMSGIAGHARRCAATAAGALSWHQPAEFELEILTLEPGSINSVLESLADWQRLQTTGAGTLPIDEIASR
jgi:hypothetical protein